MSYKTEAVGLLRAVTTGAPARRLFIFRTQSPFGTLRPTRDILISFQIPARPEFVIGTVPRWDAILPRLRRIYPHARIALQTRRGRNPDCKSGLAGGWGLDYKLGQAWSKKYRCFGYKGQRVLVYVLWLTSKFTELRRLIFEADGIDHLFLVQSLPSEDPKEQGCLHIITIF